MNVFLVRHAHAGSRGGGSRDIYRPLSEKGMAQAQSIAASLVGAEVSGIFSSPASRCVQTVEPLAHKLGLEVVEADALWEEATVSSAVALVRKQAAGGMVVSSHGNIIPDLIHRLAQEDEMDLRGRGCAKGSIWALRLGKRDRFVEARYFDLNDFGALERALKN